MIAKLLQRLERSPRLFSLLHRLGGGSDTNRRVFVNLVLPGAAVIEIGANTGQYTVLFSRLAGSKGHVHAFEPVAANFATLSGRVQTTGRRNVQIMQLAIGNECGHKTMTMPVKDLQQASLVAHTHGSWLNNADTRRELVEITTLDEYLARTSTRRVTFIKIDVEGAELSVLEGGHNSLAQFTPTLHLEINPVWLCDYGTSTGDLMRLLLDVGYRHAYVVNRLPLRGFTPLSPIGESFRISDCATPGDYVFSSSPL